MKVCRVGFTGSRPENLGGYNWESPLNKYIISKVTEMLKILCAEYDKVIVVTGGALGFDQMAGMCAQFLKEEGYNIETIVAIPFKDQYKGWRGKDIEETLERYFYIIENADKVIYVDTLPSYKVGVVPEGIYHVSKYIRRDHYMVDISDMIIACQGNGSRGTQKTMDYAEKECKPVFRIEF